jgi:protein MpaA
MMRKASNKALMVICIGSFFFLSLVVSVAVSFNNSSAEINKTSLQKTNLQKKDFNLPASENDRTVSRERTKEEFCDDINQKFINFGWKKIICNPDRWEVFNYSSGGNPIVYQTFGFDDHNNTGPINLIFCGVHGDEPPSVYLCFRLVRDILFDNPGALKDHRLVIAPIVNPDGFFANTRQNKNGIDPNRNLPTKDWDRLSHKVWSKYGKDSRKYPGVRSDSEAESKIQTFLINKYKPDKVIAVHAPLGFLDFDGPGDQKYFNLNRVEKRARFLGLNIEANSKKALKLKDFPFYPGSLGNYAGNERKIPTYTVELATADSSQANHYWTVLRFALMKALSFEVYDNDAINPFLQVQHIMQQLAHKEYEKKDFLLQNYENVNLNQETEFIKPETSQTSS